jgi:hypothetical protein
VSPSLQSEDRTDGAALLAYARMNRAVHQTLSGQIEQVLLEATYEHELAPHGREQLGVCSVPVLLGGLHPLPQNGRDEHTALGHGSTFLSTTEVCHDRIQSIRHSELIAYRC